MAGRHGARSYDVSCDVVRQRKGMTEGGGRTKRQWRQNLICETAEFGGLKKEKERATDPFVVKDVSLFSLASGLKINLQKSNLLGVGVTGSLVNEAAASIGCSVMKAPFKYLGVMVGGNMSKINAWDDMVGKIKSRLSKWKINTLSIGGRLTLLKAVLGSTPIYPMSLYKVPKTVLHEMESLRRNFFNGVQGVDRKISWVKWTKVLASKKYGGLGVSSFYALNRALLFRWVWRFLSHDNSLWFRFISAMHGSSFQIRSSFHCSNWLSIIREVSALKLQGIDFLSHCKRRVGSGMQTRFWEDLWLGEVPFNELFPRLYALENNKECSVAVKMQGEIDSSFRRHVRGGVETQQLENIQDLVRSKVLSNVDDRWAWDLNGGGDFCVKDARDLVDEVLLPKENVATRWIKTIPIKVNVFAWKLHLDRLPTRSNLLKRGIQVQSSLCPICNVLQEDTSHLFFSCDVALAISRLICRWWNVSWSPVDSYSGWLEWFNSIRLGSKLKGILEGVFYVSWWCLWNFRNQLLFASKKPRKETLFDDVVSRSFIWSNSRCNLKFTWDCWLQHPYLIAFSKFPLKLKGKFYRVAIWPAMLYGSECWPLTKVQANRMEVAKMRMLRWTCGKTIFDMIPNRVFRTNLQVVTIVNKMREGRLRWFEHVKRRPQSAPVRSVEALTVDGARRRGSPKLRYYYLLFVLLCVLCYALLSSVCICLLCSSVALLYWLPKVFLEAVPLSSGREVTVYISPPLYLASAGLGNVVVVVDTQ
ncbi:RNA-directed DNA polymerase, eukaryota [Tanacetum coccineum]